jgi:hypothetical protein
VSPTGESSESGATLSGDTGDEIGTCTVGLAGAECADNTNTDALGATPLQQGEAKEELAETGSGGTTFLLVGAATMIAGGIGFRLMPGLINRTAA